MQMSQPSIQNELLELDRGRLEAMLRSDHRALKNLLSTELRYIHSTGYIDSYGSYLEKLYLQIITYQAIECDDYHIDIRGEVAIIHSKMKASATIQGSAILIKSLTSAVWMQEDNSWKMRYFQSTPLAGQKQYE